MKRTQRLLGIDLLRGIAVYAVIILHSDETLSNYPSTWVKIINFSGFAVPFFLATSFYFAICKIKSCNYKFELKPRLNRLLIPYIFWSLFYLVYKLIKYLINNEFEKIPKLLIDPFSIIFCGGSAFHLYFLPLLICGTCLVKLAAFLIEKKLKLINLLLLTIVSFISYQLLITSGNSFQNKTGVAFQNVTDLLLSSGIQENYPILRLMLIIFAWSIRCLPYILTAVLLNHHLVRRYLSRFDRKSTLILVILFLIFNSFGDNFTPYSVYEVSRGYILLLLGLSLSMNFSNNHLIENLGFCSFGIYLIHLFVVESFQIIGNRLFPELIEQSSTYTLLFIASFTFLVTWLIINFLAKQKIISRLKII